MICTHPLKLLSPALAALLASLTGQDYCWGQPVALNNPRWITAGKLNTAREYHTATLLSDGRVLVAGGSAWVQFGNGGFASGPYDSSEIFDSATEAWRPTGSLNISRSGHTATLLPTGHVLVAGGWRGFSGVTASAELYHPATGTWRNTGSLITGPRYAHTATLLADGRVLIVGGIAGRDDPRSAELYDPATERWSPTGSPSVVSAFHTTVLLPDGKVLAIGNRTCTNTAELYDPETGRWSATFSPPVFGCADSSTLLPDGQVLVAGNGQTQSYNPATGEWSASTRLTSVGARHTAALLPNGQVMAAGGWDGGDLSVQGVELYDPVDGTWGLTTAFRRPRAGHTATRLLNGKVLVAGGIDGYCCDSRDTLDTAELFDLGPPQTGTLTSVSAASYRGVGLAPGDLAAAFGAGLPTQLAGISVRVKDSAGSERPAPVFFASPTQITYQIPPDTAPGPATVTVAGVGGAVSTGFLLVHKVAPGLFTANGDGQGVAAALLRRVRADGSSLDEPVAQFDPEQIKFVPRPIDLGPATDRVFLILFGTGIRFRSSLSAVIATVGGMYAEVSFAEAYPDIVGVDQVNVAPAAGSGRAARSRRATDRGRPDGEPGKNQNPMNCEPDVQPHRSPRRVLIPVLVDTPRPAWISATAETNPLAANRRVLLVCASSACTKTSDQAGPLIELLNQQGAIVQQLAAQLTRATVRWSSNPLPPSHGSLGCLK